jgi:ribosomal protein S18 acetylase RimI-like enzyme
MASSTRLPGYGPLNSDTITVRDAREDDLEDVDDLWEQLAKHHEGMSDSLLLATDSKKKWSRYLRERFSEISTKLIVAQEDGEIVAFMLCLLEPNVPVYRERQIGVISDVYVKEGLRRKGLARRMLDLAVVWFKKNKVRTVRLNVAAANLEARAAWRMIGFEPLMIDKRLDLARYPRPEASRRQIRVVQTRPKRRRWR